MKNLYSNSFGRYKFIPELSAKTGASMSVMQWKFRNLVSKILLPRIIICDNLYIVIRHPPKP